MQPVTSLSFPKLLQMQRTYDTEMRTLHDGDERDISPEWKTVDGAPLDSTAVCSEVYLDEKAKHAYFYCKTEKGGYTLYRVQFERPYDPGAYEIEPVSGAHQFKDEADAEECLKELAWGRFDRSLILNAHNKNKGRNCAAITLFKRNQSRSESLVEYRKKMRERQIPMKREKQWDFFVEFIESGKITTDALFQLAYYAADIDAAKTGKPSEAPKGYNATESKREFIKNAIQEDVKG